MSSRRKIHSQVSPILCRVGVAILALFLPAFAMGQEGLPLPNAKGTVYAFTAKPGGSDAPAPTALVSSNFSAVNVGASTSIYPAQVNIAQSDVVINVRVTLKITHPNVSELQVLLQAPNGSTVEVMQSHGALGNVTSGATGDTYIFDRGAATTGEGSFGGFFRPKTGGAATTYPSPAPTGVYSRDLSTFNNSVPTGLWKLFCHDNVPGNGNSGTVEANLLIETSTCNVTSGDASAGSPYPLEIPVNIGSGQIGRVKLTLNNVRHTFSDDLQLLLVSPAGGKCLLMQNCGGGNNLINDDLVFMDGGRAMPDSTSILLPGLSNVFAPTAYGAIVNLPAPAPVQVYQSTLSAAFNGQSPNGTWKLFMADDQAEDIGCFESATLEIGTLNDLSGYEGLLSPFGDTSIVAPGGSTGWSNFGLAAAENFVVTSTGNGYFAFPINAHPTKVRTSGIVRNKDGWLPLQQDPGAQYDFMGFFYVSRFGQPNPNDFNQIPNMRMRMQQRFAANSMLEVFHHTGDSAAQTAMEQELRPVLYAEEKFSTYFVPISPIHTPRSSTSGEGMQCGMEAFATLPQDQGQIRLQYVFIAYMKKLGRPTNIAPAKSFAVTSSNAGSLRVFNEAAELSNFALNYGAAADDPPVAAAGVGGTYSENFQGITLSTVGQPTLPPIRIVSRNINPEDGGTAYVSRLRCAEDQVYTARFHVTTTRIAPLQSQVRFRARSIKFAWSQKLEIGGTYAAGAINNGLARQFAPGFGTLNPERTALGDSGTWYTLQMLSPMSRYIRTEFVTGTPLSTRMPNITAQPGPGAAAASRRDLFFGLDVLDTLSTVSGFENEASQLSVDQIDVYVYPFEPV